MLELWARNRNTNQYQFIKEFYGEHMIHTMVDTLDRNKYKEAMVIDTPQHNQDGRLLFYQEFQKPFQYRKENKHGYARNK